MRLKNDESSSFELMQCIKQHYKQQQRECRFLGKSVDAENYTVDFIIDRQHIIQYSIPIDTRNFFAMVSLGVGPCFVGPATLFGRQAGDRFSMNCTTEAVEYNLNLLDEYLPKYSYCTYAECQKMIDEKIKSAYQPPKGFFAKMLWLLKQ